MLGRILVRVSKQVEHLPSNEVHLGEVAKLWTSASDLYTFCVGPDKREFTINADPIADLSPNLHSLLKNEAFAEASSKRVVWDDVKIDTFLRFCQWAHTGDYAEPPNIPDVLSGPMKALLIGNDTAMDPGLPVEDDLRLETDTIWPTFSLRSERRSASQHWKCMVCKNLFSDAECNNGCPRCPSKFYSKNTTEVRHTADPRTDLGDVIVFPRDRALTNRRVELLRAAVFNEKACIETPEDELVRTPSKPALPDVWEVVSDHAELYFMGEKWDIHRLKALSVRKIQACLCEVPIDEKAIPELFDMVRYTFVNTAASHDLLRGFVTHLVAAEIMTRDLGRRQGFISLFEEIPDFAVAIWKITYHMRMI